MKHRFNLVLLLCCIATSCAAIPRGAQVMPGSHEASVQGFVGVLELQEQDYELDPVIADDVDSDLDKLPVVGFAMQRYYVGDSVQLGIEGGLTFSWDNDTASVDTGGGLLVVSDNDVLLGDAFIGVHLRVPLGPRANIYAGAGPLLQYGRVSLEYDDAGTFRRLEESGIGAGVYARAGIEYEIGQGSRIGVFVRRIESSISLDDDIEDVDLEATQFVLAVTQIL